MDPERWRQIERVYHSALRQEEGQRAVFLQQKCDLPTRGEYLSKDRQYRPFPWLLLGLRDRRAVRKGGEAVKFLKTSQNRLPALSLGRYGRYARGNRRLSCRRFLQDGRSHEDETMTGTTCGSEIYDPLDPGARLTNN
jgi:hypothetical protein